jgi:hypothetical protein
LLNSEKISNLSVGISGTASMTKSAVDKSEMDVVEVRRPRTLSASSEVRRPLDTSLERSFSA